MYDNLVEIKVKDTFEGKADPSDYFCVVPDQDVDVQGLFFTFSNTGRYEFFYGILSFTRGRHCGGLIRYGIYK